jgi:hypothetical protein
MSEDNKKLTDQLVQAILPKLKGLSEKNAKKVLHETHTVSYTHLTLPTK